ncbi:hypothetical protein [Burkholderia thailandensis]|uniref:hypothetical protein n=1 Tax=Burkholderia thailandensis TaxID=57975 RepID=UPI00016AA361|nr:hypothetical protein [Burkholderia thailandensis]AHI73395.1 putative membrane protein [Burkholderia thailandensis 2002721723]AHI78933.1 putative membrane protein [Burkholderia thailandensis E444]AIC88973.1 putative membrane protein [Burkholderia thailandensis USAMRU Malaysia \
MQELNQQEIDLVGGAAVGGGLIGALTGLVGVYGKGLYDVGAAVTDTLAGGLIGAIQIIGGTAVGVVGGAIGGIVDGISQGGL